MSREWWSRRRHAGLRWEARLYVLLLGFLAGITGISEL